MVEYLGSHLRAKSQPGACSLCGDIVEKLFSDLLLKINQYLRKGGNVAKTKYAVLLRIKCSIEWCKKIGIEFLPADGCLAGGSIFWQTGP